MTQPTSNTRKQRGRKTTPREELMPLQTLESETSDVRERRLPALPRLRPLSPTPTYIGIGVVTIGFILLLVAWGGVAGENNVARQVPYLISGGLVGLGLILLGLTIMNIAAKRRDSALREQQMQLLTAALLQRGEDE